MSGWGLMKCCCVLPSFVQSSATERAPDPIFFHLRLPSAPPPPQSSARVKQLGGRLIQSQSQLKEALHEGEVLRVERDQLAQQVGWECVGGENREGDC